MLLLLMVLNKEIKMSQSGTPKVNEHILGKGMITSGFTLIMVRINIANKEIVTPYIVIAVIPFPA